MNDSQDFWTEFMNFCGKNCINFNAWGFLLLSFYFYMLLSFQSEEASRTGQLCVVVWMLSVICFSAPLLYIPSVSTKLKLHTKWQATAYWIITGLATPLILPLYVAITAGIPLAFARAACLSLWLNLTNIPQIVKKHYNTPPEDDQDPKT